MKTDQRVLMGVRPLASAMFASIGVRIDWRDRDSCPIGVGAIQVALSPNSTRMRHSDALAFAQPYQGNIVVFLDRLQELHRDRARFVVAHVLVHEITHVLEGVERHSATGIMKARWTDHDLYDMCRKPLPFAPEDVDLMYAGLKTRARLLPR